jgi:hypothetical protein
LPCTEVLVVEGYKLVREGGVPGLKMCKCGELARDESNCVWVPLFSLSGMVLALPFYRCKGNVGLHACVTRCLSWEGRSEVSNLVL